MSIINNFTILSNPIATICGIAHFQLISAILMVLYLGGPPESECRRGGFICRIP